MSKLKKILKNPIVQTAATVAGFYFGGPVGASLASAGTSLGAGEGIGTAALKGGLAYAGGSAYQGATLYGPPTAAQASNPFFNLGQSAASALGAGASASGGIIDKVAKVGQLAQVGGLLSGSSGDYKTNVTAQGGDSVSSTTLNEAANAATVEEEKNRKRRGGSANQFTSPLGLTDGKSAAAALLG